jgi:hypothetical protein
MTEPASRREGVCAGSDPGVVALQTMDWLATQLPGTGSNDVSPDQTVAKHERVDPIVGRAALEEFTEVRWITVQNRPRPDPI